MRGVQIRFPFCRLLLAGMVGITAGCTQMGGAYADIDSGTSAESISARYQEGSIQSVETADRALADVRTEREKIGRQFAVEQRHCYDRFFTNHCLDDVDERERSAMQQLRRVEVEANAFKRRDKVRQRDERQAQQHKQRRLPFPGEGGTRSTPSRPAGE